MTLEQAITIKNILDRELELKRNAKEKAWKLYIESTEKAKSSRLSGDENADWFKDNAEIKHDIYIDIDKEYGSVSDAREAFVNADWHF